MAGEGRVVTTMLVGGEEERVGGCYSSLLLGGAVTVTAAELSWSLLNQLQSGVDADGFAGWWWGRRSSGGEVCRSEVMRSVRGGIF